MRITLRQLVVFEAIARSGSVRQAASEIALSQSAASMSLRELEKGLGNPLFERHGKRLVLSDRGRSLQPRASSLLKQLLEFEQAGLEKTSAKGLTGNLRVGASTTIGTYILPEICAKFVSEYPEVQIELVVGSATDIMVGVQNMSFDIGFIEAASSRPSLVSRSWLGDELVFFTSPRHPLADGRRHSVLALKDATWFLQPSGSVTRAQVATALLRFLHSLRIGFVSQNVEALKNGVLQSQAIGCLSRVAIKNELLSGTLCELRLKELHLTRIFSVITRKAVYPGALQTRFIELAQAAIEPPVRKRPRHSMARKKKC